MFQNYVKYSRIVQYSREFHLEKFSNCFKIYLEIYRAYQNIPEFLKIRTFQNFLENSIDFQNVPERARNFTIGQNENFLKYYKKKIQTFPEFS